jgi:4-amino-4-deoxy-L-arabinose transferase-like glycosyltransferase
VIGAILTRRELTAWTVALLLVAALLVGVGFTSDDPDSALYADLSARLAAGPVERWIAPQWWGNWDHEGLFREHPAGVFLLPTLLGALGLPGVQAAYIVGVATALVSLVLIAAAIGRISSPADGRAALVLLQLMPLAFIFRIRANHEYPMLLCLVIAVIGIELARRSWRWIWITPVALTTAMLVKAAFVAVPLVAIGWWMLLDPLRAGGSAQRQVVALALAMGLMVATAIAYDAVYVRLTGESFWGGYWARQMAPLSIGVQAEGRPGVLHHLGFYALRMLWHPAPWSFALLGGAWRTRGRWMAWWNREDDTRRRALVFAAGFAVTTVLMLSMASRFAERYIFSPNYALAAAGIVVGLHTWPGLRRAIERLDARVPALPIVCWLLLILGRLALGPVLPRITD